MYAMYSNNNLTDIRFETFKLYNDVVTITIWLHLYFSEIIIKILLKSNKRHIIENVHIEIITFPISVKVYYVTLLM